MKNYVENYFAAYKEMKDAAIEAIKNYGKTLDVYEICKQLFMEKMGYEDESEIYEDEFYDFICENTYSCVMEGKHGNIYIVNIVKVRYNKQREMIDVYLETDDRDVSEWLPISWVTFEKDAIYQTILEFMEFAK